MKEVVFSKESEMLIDFTKELIKQYNESLTRELQEFRYKVNLNDSYERLVYKINGRKMKRYTDRLKNSLKIDLAKKISESEKELNSNQIDGIILNEISNILAFVNIQPEIIHDLEVNFTKSDKLYKCKYDLNIYDNSNLSFTKDCFRINYNDLSKPILKYIDNSNNKKTSITKSFILLDKLCNKTLNKTNYEEKYQIIKSTNKYVF